MRKREDKAQYIAKTLVEAASRVGRELEFHLFVHEIWILLYHGSITSIQISSPPT